jgi:integrase
MWGERPIAGITGAEVAGYHARVLGRGLAASTVNQARAIVHGIFALGVERFGVEPDVSAAFKRAKTRRATSDRISFYPPDEVMRLVEHAGSELDAALFLTAAFTGLRASELRALRWRSVDFGSSLVHVERGFTDEGGEDLPKSYRVRSVPMMPQVALALSQLGRREFFTGDDEVVFASDVGDVLGYDRLARRYRAAQERAGLRPLRFHDLRHSFGTMAVRQFPITDVQTWMGHADIATTRKYIHYAPQPEAAARLGALVGEQLGRASGLQRAG